MLFKIQHGLVDMVPGNIRPSDCRTRGGHLLYQPAALRMFTSSPSTLTPSESGRPCQTVSLINVVNLEVFKAAMDNTTAALSNHNLPDTVHSFSSKYRNFKLWKVMVVSPLQKVNFTVCEDY